jgi:hypothetical protein
VTRVGDLEKSKWVSAVVRIQQSFSGTNPPFICILEREVHRICCQEPLNNRGKVSWGWRTSVAQMK